MGLKKIDSGTITATGTTYVGKIGRIEGTIKKIEITASASSDFWIYSDVSSSGENDGLLDENILGVTGTKITVNTTLTAYPVVAQVIGSTNATTDPDTTTGVIVSSDIFVSVANIAAADTFRIMIWYE